MFVSYRDDSIGVGIYARLIRMKKHRSSKTISSIYNSTAILREAWSDLKKHQGKKKHHWTPADIPQWKIDKANTMRNNPTELERVLFAAIKRKFPNDRPRVYRQEIQYGYILDFYIPHLKLCIEADGPMHNVIDDQFRDRNLKRCQIRTIRFTAKEITGDAEVLDRLLHQRMYPKKR